jgi:outer membrane protein TolC
MKFRHRNFNFIGFALLAYVLALPVGAQENVDPDAIKLPPAHQQLIKPILLPAPNSNRSANNTLNMDSMRLATYPVLKLLQPLKLEASYDEPVSLAEALNYVMRNSLAIKISKESWNYQYAQFYGQLANYLPNFSTSWNLTHSNITNLDTSSNSRVYQVIIRYPVFQGGNVFYSALAQYYRQKGWRQALYTTVNDTLLDVYMKYSNVILNQALMHIRAKSVEVSEANLALNEALFKSGAGTKFAIMQSRTQLAADRQALLQQRVNTRQAALALAFSLNLPMAVNLVPTDENISEQAIIDEKLNVNDLIDIALKARPELRQYEYYRLAAARNVQVAASPLYPTASFFTAYTHSSTSIYAPSTAGGGTAGAGVFGGLFNTTQAGFSLVWSLPNFGVNNIANIVSARALSRQSLLQANQQLLLITQQVRQDYLSVFIARKQIDNAAYGVASSAEALRLAELRQKTGTGTNLELIQAQRDYINALVTQAQAIVASNQAQAQLLHDTGLISVETLTNGYQAGSNINLQK